MTERRPHVVVVGAGFGGLATVKALRKAPVDITLIDRRNHHLFQPLLYQVATAGLSPADIAGPIRSIVAKQRNVRVILDEVVGVDKQARCVRLTGGADIPYDHLVLATGARHSYFGRDDWADYAPGLKSLEDALALRRKVLLALERAETEADPISRRSLLTFVVIGGGPTGVEMAGAIAELARCSVRKDFRTITPRCSRVVLVEGGPRVLGAFPEELSLKAQRSLEQLGVELKLGARVTCVDQGGAVAGGERIDAGTIVWAAGVQASPAAQWLGAETDRAGRVLVGPCLTVPGWPGVFAIGDTVSCPGMDGKPLPGIAPVAKQQGKQVAATIAAGLNDRTVPHFAYRHYGSLATIGRSHAVIHFKRLKLSGFPAWFLWSTAHIWFLIGFRSRFTVTLNWLWNYLTFERAARLITGEIQFDRKAPAPTPMLEAAE